MEISELMDKHRAFFSTGKKQFHQDKGYSIYKNHLIILKKDNTCVLYKEAPRQRTGDVLEYQTHAKDIIDAMQFIEDAS